MNQRKQSMPIATHLRRLLQKRSGLWRKESDPGIYMMWFIFSGTGK